MNEFKQAILKVYELTGGSPSYIITGHAAMVLQGFGHEKSVKDIDVLANQSFDKLEDLLHHFEQEDIKIKKSFDTKTGGLAALYWARKPIALDFYTPESRHVIEVESPTSHIHLLLDEDDADKHINIRPIELLTKDYRKLLEYHQAFSDKYAERLTALKAKPSMKLKTAWFEDEHSESVGAVIFPFKN